MKQAAYILKLHLEFIDDIIYTNAKLFNKENINKDFEISFAIYILPSSTQNSSEATLMNILDESKSSYPGLTFRILNNSTIEYQLLAIANTPFSKNILFSNVKRVKIMRRSNVIYYSINDADKILIQDFSNFNNYFDIPVTFGGSLNSNGEPFRFYKGTISAMKIRVYDEQ